MFRDQGKLGERCLLAPKKAFQRKIGRDHHRVFGDYVIRVGDGSVQVLYPTLYGGKSFCERFDIIYQVQELISWTM